MPKHGIAGVDTMGNEELTPLLEEMKRVLNDKIDEETLRSELDKYLNEYHVDADAARRGILRKYGAIDSAASIGGAISKKIGTLTGNEQNVDVVGKVVSLERRMIKSRGTEKEIVSGTVADETGLVTFTLWDPSIAELVVDSSYIFRNCYCKTYKGAVQLNIGNRGRIEPAETDVQASDVAVSTPAETKKIGQLTGNEQNIDIVAKVMACSRRTVSARGEMKEIVSGTIADDTGAVAFTMWNDLMDLDIGSVYEFKGCYCKTYMNTVQVNTGMSSTVVPSSVEMDTVEYTPTVPMASSDLGPAEKKKIGELEGNESNIDLDVKALFVERKNVTIRGNPTDIISGTIGDDTGSIMFTIWEPGDLEMEKGKTYAFKGAYVRTKGSMQVNVGNRGKVEPIDAEIDVPDRVYNMSMSELKIKDIHEGVGNVTVRGLVVSAEVRDVVIRGENRTVWSGILADDTGKIQYSAWKDFELKENESVCIQNAYIRSWKGIPQLNLSERTEVSRIDSDFQTVEINTNMRSVADIMKNGGGIDIDIEGMVVDIRAGSGLIKRCPQCNRSILNGVCALHGQVEGNSDIRLKAVIDDGTGAIGAVIGRADTEKLTGVTLEEAESMASKLGEGAVTGSLTSKVLMRRVHVSGNVTIDDFGPSITVRELKPVDVDVVTEAKNLLKDVEANLS